MEELADWLKYSTVTRKRHGGVARHRCDGFTVLKREKGKSVYEDGNDKKDRFRDIGIRSLRFLPTRIISRCKNSRERVEACFRFNPAIRDFGKSWMLRDRLSSTGERVGR